MTITITLTWWDLLWLTPLVLWSLWWNFIATMSVRERWGTLPMASKALAVLPVIFAFLFDILCNVVTASILGGEWPREITLTKRLKRWRAMGPHSPKRSAVARWACANLINPFDKDHC